MALRDFFKQTSGALKRQVAELQAELINERWMRPIASALYPSGRIYIIPTYKFSNEQIYLVAKNSDILSIVRNALRGEIFRNGIELVEAMDTDEDVVSDQDTEGSEPKQENSDEQDIEKADPEAEDSTDAADKQLPADNFKPVQPKRAQPTPKKGNDAERRKIIQFLDRCNANGQSILDVCKQIEDDINIIDDGYMLFVFDYTFENGAPEPSGRELVEVIRIDPKYMSLVMNEQDIPGMDNDGNFLMSCPGNRTQLHVVPPEQVDQAFDPRSGQKLQRVYYKHKNTKGAEVFYFEDEIAHRSRYVPSTRLGYAPVITLWEKVQILMAMDQYMQELYQGQRPPKSLMLIRTSNKESLRAAWDDMLERARQNKHLPGMLGIQGGGAQGDSGRFAEFFDLMKGLDEMQYIEARQEMRSQIGAYFGVAPIFQNDVSTGGGLNNEGLQITVTNRASQRAQTDYNDFFFKRLLRAMGYAHWVLTLKPSEEQDEMAKLERMQLSITIGGDAVSKGLEAEWDEDKGEVIVRGGSFKKADPFQSPGGAGNPFSPGASGGAKPISPPKDTKDSGRASSGDSPKASTEGSPADVKKKRTQGFLNTTKVDEDDVMRAFKKIVDKYVKPGQKPTPEQLEQIKTDVRNELAQRLRLTADRLFKLAYLDAADEVGRELGVNFMFETTDMNALEYLENNPILQQAFSNLAQETVENIQDIILDAYRNPEGLSSPQIAERVREAAGVAHSRAENIARTEVGKVAAAARKISYEKEAGDDVMLYEHIGPSDSRTTGMCREVMLATQGGVPWDKYISILKSKAAQYFPDWTIDENAPLAHYQCRHTFIATRKP